MKTNKSISRYISVMMAVLTVFCLLCVFVDKADAKSSRYISVPDTMFAGQTAWLNVYDYNDPTFEGEIVSTKLSKTGILKFKTIESVRGCTAKKPGKVTLTVTYEYEGKKHKISQPVTVKKYPKAIKKLKINGKSVKMSTHKYEVRKKNKSSKPKIKMTLKKGWKIDSITAYAFKGNKSKDIKLSKSTLKKGKAIKLPKGYKSMYIFVSMKNSKNESISYEINLYN